MNVCIRQGISQLLESTNSTNMIESSMNVTISHQHMKVLNDIEYQGNLLKHTDSLNTKESNILVMNASIRQNFSQVLNTQTFET